MPPALPPLHIPLFLNTREHWGRLIARGVLASLRERTDWIPFLASEAILDRRKVSDQIGRHWAGVIGQFYSGHHSFLRQLADAGIPVVNVSAVPPPAGIGWIHCDDRACGQIAAHHFRERNYRHFAFTRIPGAHFSEQREKGFLESIGQALNGSVHIIGKSISPHPGQIQPLADELKNLPRPCAIFCSNDIRARHCLQATDTMGISVPEELAILGVDDDDLYCNMARVPLSSVQPDWERIGQRALEALLQLHKKPTQNPPQEMIPPCGISIRRSSHFFVAEDALVARAMQHIQKYQEGKLSTNTLAQELGVSRRTLERRFTRELNRTLHETFMEARLQRAHNLILESNLPIGEIAALTGFSKHSQFNDSFKRRFAQTPRSLRKLG